MNCKLVFENLHFMYMFTVVVIIVLRTTCFASILKNNKFYAEYQMIQLHSVYQSKSHATFYSDTENEINSYLFMLIVMQWTKTFSFHNCICS